MQIGPRHKVACHFAGELGHHPAQPVTARLLDDGGTGRPDEAASLRAEVATEVGYADRWFDLPSQTVVTGARKEGGEISPPGENLPPQS